MIFFLSSCFSFISADYEQVSPKIKVTYSNIEIYTFTGIYIVSVKSL